MKVFLDANILVAVLCKEYPLYTHAAKLVSLADNKRYTFYTSAVCLAIAFYFAEKKHGHASAKDRIGLLSKHIRIAACGEKEVLESSTNRKINDFEDGLQYYAALHSGCKVIVTEDRDDFYFSDKMEILTTYDFLKRYVVRNAW